MWRNKLLWSRHIDLERGDKVKVINADITSSFMIGKEGMILSLRKKDLYKITFLNHSLWYDFYREELEYIGKYPKIILKRPLSYVDKYFEIGEEGFLISFSETRNTGEIIFNSSDVTKFCFDLKNDVEFI
jgi:hypothetical protein